MSGHNKQTDYPERRRHRRFRLRRPAFVVLDSDPVKLREVLDLGMSGLAITSLDGGAGSLARAHRVAIVSRIRGHEAEEYLGGLPCRIVSEEKVSEFPPTPYERRRYGIELVDLTPVQRQKLARFIIANADEPKR